MRIQTISEELKEKYGEKVMKLSLSSGCTCPNRDGTCGTGGCSFCSEGGSGEFAAPLARVEAQLAEAKRRVDHKFPAGLPEKERKYIAYFQSFANTYGPVEKLRKLYLETIRRPEIVALSLGTRPDCLPEEMMAMLRELNGIKIHLLHLLRGTRMAAEWEKEPFPLLAEEEYIQLVAEVLSELPEEVVVHRLTGDAPRELLVEPRWSLDKKHVLNRLRQRIAQTPRREMEAVMPFCTISPGNVCQV